MLVDLKKFKSKCGFSLMVFISLIFLCIFIVSCDRNSSNSNQSQPQKTGPSNLDIIRAVYNHLQGKFYTDFVTETQSTQIPCTQIDYDTDPFKNGPNSKCRGSGGAYGFGYKTVNRSFRKSIKRRCPSPPAVNSSQWRVSVIGTDSWLVSNNYGRWRVFKQGSTYRIEPQQKC